MKWRKPRKATIKKPQALGHYRPPQVKVSGLMNMPRRGRVGKMLPSPKKLGPGFRRG
jgi:hypothetical protein